MTDKAKNKKLNLLYDLLINKCYDLNADQQLRVLKKMSDDQYKERKSYLKPNTFSGN